MKQEDVGYVDLKMRQQVDKEIFLVEKEEEKNKGSDEDIMSFA